MDEPRTPVALIAEFCQNHNGDFDILARMVDAAAANGASHGKLQTIFADDIAFRPQFEEGLEIDGEVLSIRRPYHQEYDRLKDLEIGYEEIEHFIALCHDHGLEPMTTCFTRSQVVPLSQVGFKTIKVASYDCSSFPMLRELAAQFDHLIVSTGATYDEELEHAAKLLQNTDFAFLHCVTIYPTPLDEMHLARLQYLAKIAPHVGFSDHSLVARDGIHAAKAAVYLGAEIIERHFTILPSDQTRDGPVSISPDHLKELAAFTRFSRSEQLANLEAAAPGWKRMVGQERRELSHAELLNRDYYRGRFASRRMESKKGIEMIFNWEETPLP